MAILLLVIFGRFVHPNYNSDETTVMKIVQMLFVSHDIPQT